MAMTKRQQKRSFTGFLGANEGERPAEPVNTVAPSIAGVAQVGETLSSTLGTWTGIPAPSLTRQWAADGEAIAGAVGASYVLTEAEEGKEVTLIVTGANWKGQASATSAATEEVEPAEEADPDPDPTEGE